MPKKQTIFLRLQKASERHLLGTLSNVVHETIDDSVTPLGNATGTDI